jgi:hypothetical protein
MQRNQTEYQQVYMPPCSVRIGEKVAGKLSTEQQWHASIKYLNERSE